MKLAILFVLCWPVSYGLSQNLQLHYDLRHTIDPKHNTKNYPSVYFDYFKLQDSGHAFIKPGSFLFTAQADLLGAGNNIGKFYMQVAQTFRCWKPLFFLHLSYTGGLGVTQPAEYSFYIQHNYYAGIAYPHIWSGLVLSNVLDCKYVSYPKPSFDPFYTLYFYKGLFNYKMELSGDFSIWTENKNHGDAYTMGLHGKRFFFFAEPQVWYKLTKNLLIGSKINMYYHVYTSDNLLQVYPAIAVKCKL